MRKAEIDLKNDSIKKLLTHYTFASVVGMVISSIHSVIDTVFISRGVGSLGIASINTVLPILSWSWALLILFATGGSTIHAIKKGGNDLSGANDIFYTTTVIISATVAVLMILGIIFIEPICLYLGCTKSNLTLAVDYIRTILFFLPFYGYNALMSRFVKNDGNPRIVTFALLASAVVNLTLDYIFIFPMQMSMMGAALATGIAQCVGAVILSTHFWTSENTLSVDMRQMKLSIKNILHISKTGFPAFLSEGSFAVTLVFMNRAIRSYAGTTGIAALGIMFTLLNFLYLLVNGIATATQPIIGFNHGAGQHERVFKTLKTAIILSFAASLVLEVFSISLAGKLVRLINDSDESLIAMATQVTRINFTTMPLTALASCVQAFYQSTDRALLASVLTVVRSCISVLICMYVLMHFFGLLGIWWAYPVSDIVNMGIYAVCYVSINKKYRTAPSPV